MSVEFRVTHLTLFVKIAKHAIIGVGLEASGLILLLALLTTPSTSSQSLMQRRISCHMDMADMRPDCNNWHRLKKPTCLGVTSFFCRFVCFVFFSTAAVMVDGRK